MQRSMIWAGRLAVAAGLCCLWFVASHPSARATAFGGTAPPQRAAAAPLLPTQAQPPQNVEASLGMLHQRLGITPAQEPAFAALANVMRENARMTAGAAPPANADAVYQLQLAIQYGQQEVDGMRRLLPALRTLYASLSPAQRGIANQVFRQGPGQ